MGDLLQPIANIQGLQSLSINFHSHTHSGPTTFNRANQVFGNNATLHNGPEDAPTEDTPSTMQKILDFMETLAGQQDNGQVKERLQLLGKEDDANDAIDEDRQAELLDRLALIMQEVLQKHTDRLTQEDGPLLSAIRKAATPARPMQGTANDNGFDLSDDGVDLSERLGGAVDSPPRKPAAKRAPTKDDLANQLKNLKPKEIIEALGVVSNESMLGTDVLEHFENVLSLIKEMSSGELQIPSVKNCNLLTELGHLQGMKGDFCTWLGKDLILYEGCFISISDNDNGDVHEDGEQVRSEVLLNIRTPCVIGQHITLTYQDESEATIDFNSALVSDAAPALNLIFQYVANDSNVKKVFFQAPVDKVCKLEPGVLTDKVGETVILHFQECDLTHSQLEALASLCNNPIIFEKCGFEDNVERFLFPTENQHLMKLAFKGRCPKFGFLLEHVNQLSALMIHGVELTDELDGNFEANTEALKNLVEACAESTCDLCLGDLTKNNKPFKIDGEEYSSSTGESINKIADLGRVLVLEDQHGKKLYRKNKKMTFFNYQKDAFTIGIDETQEHIGKKNATVKLLASGRLQYTFEDGTSTIAAVPSGAKPTKFWCVSCANGCCGLHKLPN